MSTQATEKPINVPAKVIVATTLGNGLEWYDFTVFSFFSAIIGKLFFPFSNDPLASWLFSLAVFWIGFIMRPIGSIVIGNYADKHGRKPALTLSLLLMAIGTALIAFTPTYASIGIAAPIIIVLARLIQGFSAGGEVGSSSSFLMESGRKENRAFMLSWQIFSQGISAFLGALTGTLLFHFLPTAALESWGWRVPFFIGIFIAPVGIYIRLQLNETLSKEDIHRPTPSLLKTQKSESSFSRVIKNYPLQLLFGTFMVLSGTTVMYIIVFYLPNYAIKVLHMPASGSYLTSCVTGIVLMIFPPIFGKLTDKIENKKIPFLVGSALQAAAVIPFFVILHREPNFFTLLTGAALIILFLCISMSSFYLLILEAFPSNSRATGLGLIYAVGVAIFGGSSQFTVTLLIEKIQSEIAPAYYTMVCCLLAILASAFFPKKKFD